MHLLLLLALASLAPGRYVGIAAAGRVDLELTADGHAIYGGAPYRWRLEASPKSGDTLRLTAEHGELALRFVDGCLLGPPFGRVCLTSAPLPPETSPPAPPRPEAWRGAWAHTASGGTLVLELRPDGAYEMRQPEAKTTGRWRGDAGGFTLIPAGGAPLRYRARRSGPDLWVGGGDLPGEVRFRRFEGPRYTPPPPVSGGDP